MDKRRFTLTADHLKLLRTAYVDWEDCETGAPCINPKRPYGNSDVAGDIAEILGIEVPEEGLDSDTKGRLLALHRETQDALQVILDTQSFEVGDYECERYGGDWQRVGGQAEVTEGGG